MNRPPEPPHINRILVALDAASFDAAAFETAAQLAARVEADLHGLFIEDADLLALAGLDLVRHVTPAAGAPRFVDAPTMERELRALAGPARRRFEQAAARSGVSHAFRVVRGKVTTEIEQAATEFDLVVVEGVSRPVSGHMRLRPPSRVAARRATCSVLLLRAGTTVTAPMIAIHDGAAGADRALAMAIALADRTKSDLIVLAIGHDAKEAAERVTAAREKIADSGAEARIEPVTRRTGDDVLNAVLGIGGGMMVLPADHPLIEGDEGERLIDRCGCPVLLVR